MKISEFIVLVQSDSRKRTGVLLADSQFSQTVTQFKQQGFQVVDCADYYQKNLFLTDDQLVSEIRSMVHGKNSLVLNLEMFIAPRIKDSFLKQFVEKLAAEEPTCAFFLLLYSSLLFKKFDQIYQHSSLTDRHTLDLSEQTPTN